MATLESLYRVANSSSDLEDDLLTNVEINLLMLRKPTELKKVIDSLPKPIRAVPKNGLPKWYKLGLECKLPVPQRHDRIVFSRGKIGEDIRRIGLGADGPSPTFDLSDPNCYSVSYDYEPLHDPHLAHHFRQKPHRDRMKDLGLCTPDNRAVCSLKEFNQYRKYLYLRFMDRIHMEMKALNERARDDLTLKRVEADVARRNLAFNRAEKAREHLEKYAQMFSDEIAEKKRQAWENDKKIRARMQYLIEFKQKQRKERLIRLEEKENRIKQRVTAAAELEIKRRITMVRTWRINEKRRLARLKQIRQAKERHLQEKADREWNRRVAEQNRKIQQEALLLKLYTEDMSAGAKKRYNDAQLYAYNNDLNFQKIKLENWKLRHGASSKAQSLVKTMGKQFEKSKRGAKGMSSEFAQLMAQEAMKSATSTKGDAYMTLGQARQRMDILTITPPAPIKILDQIIETVVVEFARRRVHLLLRDVEEAVKNKYLNIIFGRRYPEKHRKKRRLSVQVTSALAHHYANSGQSLTFVPTIQQIQRDPMEEDLENLKSIKTRVPTPVPSLTKLAEVTFFDKLEDLPGPVTTGRNMPERRKLLEMVNTAAKVLSRLVSQRVDKGLDLNIRSVTMPHLRRKIEWGEAVECLADAVVNSRINVDCAEVRRVSEYLSYRVLQNLQAEMKADKARQKALSHSLAIAQDQAPQDFYVPGQADDNPEKQLQQESTLA